MSILKDLTAAGENDTDGPQRHWERQWLEAAASVLLLRMSNLI